MIVRGGNRTVTDLGPAPARIAGIYAINTIATAPETHVAPVERRYLSHEELARIHEDDALLDPQPVQITLPSRQSTAQFIARSRGGQASARHSLDALWDALRRCDGVIYRAARELGQDPTNVRRRVEHWREEMPADVAALMARPHRRAPHTPETKALLAERNRGLTHTPATRALISVRRREQIARDAA